MVTSSRRATQRLSKATLFYFFNWKMDKQEFLILLIFILKCVTKGLFHISVFYKNNKFQCLSGNGAGREGRTWGGTRGR